MPTSFITSIVGWSLADAEAKTEAPIRSPAPTMSELAAGTPAVSYSSFLTVPAHFTVLASMRPWKSLMPTRLILTGSAACAGAMVPATMARDPATRLTEAPNARRTLLRCRTSSAFRLVFIRESTYGGGRDAGARAETPVPSVR